MGLFDRFRGKKKTKAESDSLRDYSGLRMEVFDQDDQFLFMAVLLILQDATPELRQLADAPDIPWEIGAEPFHAKLRAFDSIQKLAVHLEGIVSRVDEDVLKIERLRLVSKDNDRAFFRQGINAVGEVYFTGDPDAFSWVCELRNVSAGGVCLRMKEEDFQIGDELTLRARLSPEQDISEFPCIVRRVTPKRGGMFEYGCQFVNLTAADQDRISRAIMEIQQNLARRSMGR